MLYIFVEHNIRTYFVLIGPGGSCGRKYFIVTTATTYKMPITPMKLKMPTYNYQCI